MKIYGIKNCDTMQKAFAALEARKLAYEFHDYKKDGVPPGNEARALALLERNPSAIKRPVLEAGAKLLVGFDPSEYAQL